MDSTAPRLVGALGLVAALAACAVDPMGSDGGATDAHGADVAADARADAMTDPGVADSAEDARADGAVGDGSPLDDAASPDADAMTVVLPTTPTGLVAFTGGSSIAIRWGQSTGAASAITGYEVLRDGTHLAHVAIEAFNYNVEFPEVNGCSYVDRAVTRGHTYAYAVQAVDAAGHLSAPSAVTMATHPMTTTATPTITVDATGATDLGPWLNNTVKPFLLDWFPKVADRLVAGGYPVFTSIHIGVDASTGYAYTSGSTINFNPTAVRNDVMAVAMHQVNHSALGAFLHETTHVIQGTPHGGGNGVGWMIEGEADWVREYMLHDRDPGFGPTESYTAGYSPASYLLDYSEHHATGADFLRTLNVAQGTGHYSDNLFHTATGMTVAQLWTTITTQPMTLPSSMPFASVTGRCVTYVDANMNAVQLATCHPFKPQRWRLVRRADGALNVIADWTACMAPDGGTANGTHVLAHYACDQSATQGWRPTADGALVNVQSGRCLTDPGGVSTEGTALVIRDCDGSSGQRFDLPPY